MKKRYIFMALFFLLIALFFISNTDNSEIFESHAIVSVVEEDHEIFVRSGSLIYIYSNRIDFDGFTIGSDLRKILKGQPVRDDSLEKINLESLHGFSGELHLYRMEEGAPLFNGFEISNGVIIGNL